MSTKTDYDNDMIVQGLFGLQLHILLLQLLDQESSHWHGP